VKLKTMFRKRIRLAVVTGLASALLMTACGSDNGTNEPGAAVDPSAVVEDGALTFGLSTEPANLYIGQDAGVVGYTMYTLLHRGLMAFDETGEVVEGLAESYDQPEPAQYNFTLREGLEFSDGTALTSDVVKENLEYQMEV